MNVTSLAQRLLCSPYLLTVALVFAVGWLWPSGPAEAKTGQQGVLVVRDDRGGLVGTRATQIKRIKRSGQRVEIRGNICLSSCTMYLGAGNVCVSPDTRFGFHGPSYYGRPLMPTSFNYWSEVIAAHYPAPLRKWFMKTGRHRTDGYYTIAGYELIRLGVQSCGSRGNEQAMK